ncbi:uncharacterized protein (DUF885 family) [Kitasatospora sp. MAA4]|uniref:DUF885 domain-containing protein n=1 Tax=Kitasatospora sp. MAA4 TaxID=3035093 RepID=UPI002473B2C0|nr:DUF885 domain-containing protein [Kitasatospora sp. MAA4]MDH6137659.1 uncharacterized protein (DUF885 family) [Kitasatospora sp. MAA4]
MAEESITARSIADAHLDRVTALDPMVSTWLGVNPGDDRQLDLSLDGFDARAELARQALAALAPVTPQGPEDEVCARLLRERLTAELAVHEAGDHLRQLRNIGSPVQWVREIFTYMPTETDEDWAAVAGRLRNLPGALAGCRATLTEGIARGLLSAPRQAAAVADQYAAWTAADWFTGFAARGTDRLRPELDAAARQATAAVGEFSAWLRADYLPAAAGTPDGVGRERYLRAARFCTGADLDLDEAYGWAWAEFHRMNAELRAEAERVLPGASPLEAVRHLDERGHTVDGEEGIRVWLQELMDEAIEALDGRHFDISPPVRRVESLIAPEGSAAAPYYSGPSLDFTRPGRTYLPTLGRKAFPTWQLVSIWYHEGVPGHHLQLAQWNVAAAQLSRYQVTLGKVSANIEGWALYAERLMDDLGFLTEPARRFGFLDEQMLRTIRVIIDIGMHLRLAIPADSGFHPGERWTPALAAEFMAAYNGSPAEMRSSEIDRYLGWPGQAIGYKLGERAWREGRAAAERRLGAAFDLKAWHMKALSQGSLGLDDLAGSLAGL